MRVCKSQIQECQIKSDTETRAARRLGVHDTANDWWLYSHRSASVFIIYIIYRDLALFLSRARSFCLFGGRLGLGGKALALLRPCFFVRGFFRIFFMIFDIVHGSSEVLAGFFVSFRRLLFLGGLFLCRCLLLLFSRRLLRWGPLLLGLLVLLVVVLKRSIFLDLPFFSAERPS